jgi:hypothetical protein
MSDKLAQDTPKLAPMEPRPPEMGFRGGDYWKDLGLMTLASTCRSFTHYSIRIATRLSLSPKGIDVNSRGWNPWDRFGLFPALQGSNQVQTLANTACSTPTGLLLARLFPWVSPTAIHIVSLRDAIPELQRMTLR